jgi:RES domain-containing protein
VPDLRIIELLDELPRSSFRDEAFRHQGPGYHPLSGEGARIQGGRWNPSNSFPVLYLAVDASTAAAEFFRRANREGRPPEDLLPRRLYRYRVELSAVLDLRGPDELTQVGLSFLDLSSDDLSKCQAVGEAAHYVGFESIRAPSATSVGGNLAIFFDRLLPDSMVEPLDFETWESLPSTDERT